MSRARAGAAECPKSAPRSPKRVQKRSFGLFFDSFRTPGRTLWGLWGSPGPSGPGTPFRTLFGLFWGSGPPGRGGSQGTNQGSGFHIRFGGFQGLPWQSYQVPTRHHVPVRNVQSLCGCIHRLMPCGRALGFPRPVPNKPTFFAGVNT